MANVNLMGAAAEIFNKGFDPEKDPVSEFEQIADGTYKAIIDGFEFKEFSTGTQAFQFKVKILEEPYENRIHFANLFLTEKGTATSIKTLLKHANRLNIELEPDDFADTDIIVEKMQEAIEYECVLTLKTNKNDFQSFKLEF